MTLAQRAVELLDVAPGEVEAIDIVAGGRDPAADDGGRLRPPYALQTLLDELTLSLIVLRDGRAIEIEPLSSGGVIDFGEPIGRADTIYTLHSELRTFADSFGCRSASFRLSLPPRLVAGLRDLVGVPADDVAAAVRLFARGSLDVVGAMPPEQCIEPGEMFAELESRGCTFSVVGPE